MDVRKTFNQAQNCNSSNEHQQFSRGTNKYRRGNEDITIINGHISDKFNLLWN